MTDYISREAVVKYLEYCSGGYDYIETETKGAIDDIKAIPAVDVRPIRYGRWIETGEFSDEPIDWVMCDRCKAKIPYFGYSYCPNCGAYMKEES